MKRARSASSHARDRSPPKKKANVLASVHETFPLSDLPDEVIKYHIIPHMAPLAAVYYALTCHRSLRHWKEMNGANGRPKIMPGKVPEFLLDQYPTKRRMEKLETVLLSEIVKFLSKIGSHLAICGFAIIYNRKQSSVDCQALNNLVFRNLLQCEAYRSVLRVIQWSQPNSLMSNFFIAYVGDLKVAELHRSNIDDVLVAALLNGNKELIIKVLDRVDEENWILEVAQLPGFHTNYPASFKFFECASLIHERHPHFITPSIIYRIIFANPHLSPQTLTFERGENTML